jgi:hypothetical protein
MIVPEGLDDKRLVAGYPMPYQLLCAFVAVYHATVTYDFACDGLAVCEYQGEGHVCAAFRFFGVLSAIRVSASDLRVSRHHEQIAVPLG